jgi:hypothetical protein
MGHGAEGHAWGCGGVFLGSQATVAVGAGVSLGTAVGTSVGTSVAVGTGVSVSFSVAVGVGVRVGVHVGPLPDWVGGGDVRVAVAWRA